jgi:hypothetical protein
MIFPPLFLRVNCFFGTCSLTRNQTDPSVSKSIADSTCGHLVNITSISVQ